ncbi:hypothetical protein, partial [Zoogloea sp.]|uniref:hypothetical protein n=1 Tax=Zoogloea sp. TaxID=49181 RepID=UPI0031FCAC63
MKGVPLPRAALPSPATMTLFLVATLLASALACLAFSSAGQPTPAIPVLWALCALPALAWAGLRLAPRA